MPKFDKKMYILRINTCKPILLMTLISLTNLVLVSTKTGCEGCKKLGAISNDFALNLMRELRTKEETRNIFISPLSISMTFGMLYYASSGNTADELQDVLGYQKAGMTKEDILLTLKHFFTDELQKSANFTLNAANAILVDKKLKLFSDFKDKIQGSNFADVRSVDFQTDSSKVMKDINSWVSKQTNGKILQLLENLDQKTVFMILNAVYFKSLWKYPFNSKQNQMYEFLNNNKKSKAKSIEMMHMTRVFGTAEVADCETLELPYEMDDIVMLIMLPKGDLKSLEKKLTHKSIVSIVKAMDYDEVEVAIPKFKFEFSENLIPELKKLGLKTVFDEADFSGMIKHGRAPVSDFLHKTVIEVTEKGTEAAAATSTATARKLVPSFIVDRPFVFSIVDKRTNFVLFLGRVSNL